MEKTIRNANKARKIPRRNGRKVSALLKKQGRNRKALLELPGIPQDRQQNTEALGPVIPCRVAEKPDRLHPLRLEIPCPCGKDGCITIRFQCEQCTAILQTLRSWRKHAGMVSNIKGDCPGDVSA